MSHNQSTDIQLLQKWLEEAGQKLITELVIDTVKKRRLGPKVTIKFGEILVVEANGSHRNSLKNTEIDDGDDYKIDVLLPLRASILKQKPGTDYIAKEPVQCLPGSFRYDHPISKLFLDRSKRHRIVVAVPDIEKVFKSKGIGGMDKYGWSLETVYRNPKDLIPHGKHIPPATEGDPYVFVEPVGPLEWDITSREHLLPSRNLWCNWTVKFPWIIYPILLILLIALVILVLRLSKIL